MKIVYLQTISELTGIPLSESEIQNPKNLGDYIHLMGDHCKSAQGGGISAKMTYENVYALCRWLHQNIFGVSHVSSFYNQALHIIYILMTKEKHFCMCRTFLDTIGSAKDRRKTFLPLPKLVTQIYKEWMSNAEFNLAMHERVKIVTESVSSYQASLQIDWTLAMLKEQVVISSSSSSDSKDEDNEFFEQEPPEDNRGMTLI